MNFVNSHVWGSGSFSTPQTLHVSVKSYSWLAVAIGSSYVPLHFEHVYFLKPVSSQVDSYTISLV